MKVKLKVISSNPTENGNFCNKLQAKTTVRTESAFGVSESERQVTYYLFTQKQNEVGMEAELDLSLFDIQESPFEYVDEAGNQATAMLKKLYPKAS